MIAPHSSVALLSPARRRTLAGAPLFALLALAGCGGAPPEKRAAELAPVETRLAKAERSSAAHRNGFAGTVEAAKSTAVSSRVMAMVTAVHVQLGDSVKAGQTLVSIDATAAQGQVAQAQGGLAQAQAALTLAKRNLERFEALAASNSASALELDLARSQYEQAAGAVQQAQGAVDAASSVARESRVTAPFAGRVAARLVEIGDLAAPGRPLVRIESSAGRRLVAAVPESVAHDAALAPGLTVAVGLDARPDLGELAGTVAEVSPGPDPVSHSYTVKVDLPAADLPAGAAGRLFLTAGTRDSVRVPRPALIESGGLTLVVVRNEAGLAETRVVTVGASAGGDAVEILSGLAGGESVAVGLAVAPPAGVRLEEVEP